MNKEIKLSLFLYLQHKLEEGIKKSENHQIGYIYMIVNNKNDQTYIGSTLRIEKRLEEHIKSATSGELVNKFHKHIKENNAEYKLSVLYKTSVNLVSEMYSYEDMYIYKYDTITNGLNTKYNLSISIDIIRDDISIEEKYKRIDEFVKSNVTFYNKRLEFIGKNLPLIKSLKDKKLKLEDKYWMKKGILEVYNYLLIDNYSIKLENNVIEYGSKACDLPENIYVVYMIYWPHLRKHDIFYIKNGIKNLINEERIGFFKRNHILDSMTEYGMNLIIQPISYIRTKETDEVEINKRLEMFKKELKNIIDMYVFSETNMIEKMNETIVAEMCKADDFDTIIKNAYNYNDTNKLVELLEILKKNQKIKEDTYKNKYENILNTFNKEYEKHEKKKSKLKKSKENQNIENLSNNKNIEHLETKEINKREEIRNVIANLYNDNPKNIEQNNPVKRKRGRPKKYKNTEEAKKANKLIQKNWKSENKDPTKLYNKKYYANKKMNKKLDR